MVNYYAVYHVGRLDARQKLDQVLLSVGNKCQLLEKTETTAVRNVMLEEHGRFCLFVDCLQPLMVSYASYITLPSSQLLLFVHLHTIVCIYRKPF